MSKPVVPREVALRDVEDAIDRYADVAGAGTALRFVGELERAYRLVGQHPGAGSLRYAYALDLPDLRHVALRRFPYLVFYRELEDRIDVWRVLHGRRDVPASILGTPP